MMTKLSYSDCSLSTPKQISPVTNKHSSRTPLFARQAIYNKDREVIAYELLFRHSDVHYRGTIDGDHATSNVLLNVFGERRIEDFIGSKKAFINFTQNLLGETPPLPNKRLVIEVLEDIPATDEVLNNLKQLRDNGFDLALDDFFITEDTKKMIKYASIIKVDVLALSRSQLNKYVEFLKPFNIMLLAEKVEDHEMMNYCIELGFDLFQGYFLCKPEVVKGLKISEGRQSIIQLLSKLNNPDTPFDDVVKTIATDPNLSFKILKLVNSSAMGLPRTIESLNQAVTLLGMNAIRSWANFLLLANAGDKPKELSSITMSRARFCELLGHHIEGRELSESAFTTGVLSTIDAFLDTSKEELFKQLTLSKSIEYALRSQQGLLGTILKIALDYERGAWQTLDWDKLHEYGLSQEKMNTIYMDSTTWAMDAIHANA